MSDSSPSNRPSAGSAVVSGASTSASPAAAAPDRLADAPDRLAEAKTRLIVALDQPSRNTALEMAAQLQGVCQWVKVGLELYLAAGQRVVEELAAQGFSVFLDLKLHDIPNTVAGAVRSVSSSGAALLTVHAAGGPAMLAAAAEAASGNPNAPRLLAVTVLTSMDAAQLAAIGISDPAEAQVLRLARMALAAGGNAGGNIGGNIGIAGLVCSPQEVALLRKELGDAPLLVVPGIRPVGGDTPSVAVAGDDQKRVATPAAAIAAGASMLVVGRPITQAEDPAKAAETILNQMTV